ncbi:MAG: YceI family protein [Candidatus Acidiferrales bacterium]
MNLREKTKSWREPNTRFANIGIFLAAACLILLTSSIARAQDTTLNLDPAQTRIEFTLGATMHTVHGTFKLKSGQIRFNPKTGKASGAVIVDATTGDTDNSSRDKKMHREVLESLKFGEIIFTPDRVQGAIASTGISQVDVHGNFRLHGQDHPLTMTFAVAPSAGNQLQATTHFAIPYVTWGLKNPSTFILHVSDTVDITIHATGHIAMPSQAAEK